MLVDELDKEHTKGSQFVINGRWQFICLNLQINLHLETLFTVFLDTDIRNEHETNFLQCFVVSIFLLLPMMFMQFFIGQVTQRGCHVISRMAPIIKGIEYSMIGLTLVGIFKEIRMTRDAVAYAIFSVYQPWVDCLKEPCITPQSAKQENAELTKKALSTYQFFEAYERDDPRIGDTTSYIILVCLFIVVYYTSRIDYRRHFVGFCRLSIFKSIVIASMSILMLLTRGNAMGFSHVGNAVLDIESYGDLTCWAQAIVHVLHSYHLGIVTSVLFGSFLHHRIQTELMSFESWLCIMFADIVVFVMVITAYAGLSQETGISIKNLRMNYMEVTFVLFPHLLANGTGAELFSLLFFILVAFCCLLEIEILMMSAFITLCYAHPKLTSYKNYLIFTVTLLACLLAIPYLQKFYILRVWEMKRFICMMAILFFETVAVMWIYGVTNFSDDYHFKHGHQPRLFWKITWGLLPLFILGSTVMAVMKLFKYEQPLEFYVQTPAILTFIFLPQFIILILQILRHLRNKSLSKLFKKDDLWADPDPLERKARLLYPPRKTVRYRRRYDVCKHQCLRYSQLLKLIVAKEEELRYEEVDALAERSPSVGHGEVGHHIPRAF